ncbi:hypothetical protein [Ferruginibacter sp.]
MNLINCKLFFITGIVFLCVAKTAAQTTSTDNTLNSTGVTAIQSTTSSNYQLSVGGAVKIFHSGNSGLSSASLYLLNTSSSGREYFINSDNAGSFRIVDNTAGTPRFIINNSGNVGIGTTSPTDKLHVDGSVKLGNTAIAPSSVNAELWINSPSGQYYPTLYFNWLGQTGPNNSIQYYDSKFYLTTSGSIRGIIGPNWLIGTTTDNGQKLQVNGDALVSGNITSPGTGSGSEKFGNSASVGAHNYSAAFGSAAITTGNESIAFGYNTKAAQSSVAMGSSAQATGFASTLIGSGASDNGQNYITAIGAANSNAGYFSGGLYLNGGLVNIGYNNNSANNNNTFLIGANLSADRSNQLLIGNGLAGGFITDMVLGGGLSNSLAASYGGLSIRTTDGSGANAAGMPLIFKAGKSTGSASGGYLSFYTTPAGSSGSTTNAEVERMRINENGAVLFNSAAGTSGQVLTSAGAGAPPTWTSISGGSSTNWSLSGNAGTDPTTHFIGTTDDKDFIIKANNNTLGVFRSNRQSVALGIAATVTGANSSAIGYNASGSGDLATAIGYNTTASATYATAMGYLARATGSGSVSIGSNTTASGDYSMATGTQTIARSYGEYTAGIFNTDYTPTSINSFVNSDRLFTVGNGVDDAHRSNALTILKGGNIGIGTSNPVYKIHAYGVNPTLYLEGDDNSYYTTIILKSVVGTGVINNYGPYSWRFGMWSMATSANNKNSGIGATTHGNYAVTLDASLVPLNVMGAQGQTNDLFKVNKNISTVTGGVTEENVFSINKDGNVGIGTNNTTGAEYKLYVETGIRTRKVKVDVASWPDYVFTPSYKPISLTDLEKYLLENKHLPDVPSAEEVEKNGVDLGSNQSVLLKKVEELTLYMIELSKKVDALTKENQALKKKKNK